ARPSLRAAHPRSARRRGRAGGDAARRFQPARQALPQRPDASWQAIRLGAQVAHALAHAHAQGLTHGAVKPENVLLDRAGNALLSDFGAARLVALPAAVKEGPRVMVELGDAAYRAPEVSAGDPGGTHADAVALGG